MNPPVFSDGEEILPVADLDEKFILSRNHIRFEVAIQNKGKFVSRKGRLFITTKRLLYIPSIPITQGHHTMHSYAIPVDQVIHGKFNQPLLGPNNFTGKIEEDGHKIIHWKISFYGATGVVLPIFLILLDNKDIAEELIQRAKDYYDPHDPSIIYTTQPKRQLTSM